MNLFSRYRALNVSDFKVKIPLQKWSQTSPKSILALQNLKKLTKHINNTFQYLPRLIDTIFFLVVYEPHKALEGLQGVRFQGTNCFTKMVSNFSEINYGFT